MCHVNGLVELRLVPSSAVIESPVVNVASRHASLREIVNSSVKLDLELITVILVRKSVPS
jgi:hypothetical protein